MPADTVLLFRPALDRVPQPVHRMRTQWPAEIQLRDNRLKCIVVDISPSGARLRLMTLPEVGTRAWLSIEGNPLIPAEVAWQKDCELGLRFLEQQPWVMGLETSCPFARTR